MNVLDRDGYFKALSAAYEESTDVNMTTLKPLLVTACYCARYFNRDENKSERVKQAVLDVELLLKELGLADATKPAAK